MCWNVENFYENYQFNSGLPVLCIRIDQTQHSSLCQQTKRGRYCLCNASVRLNGRERVMSIFKVALLIKGTETTSCKDNM